MLIVQLLPLCPSSTLLYQKGIPAKALKAAALQLLRKYPILGGRYDPDGPQLSVRCCNEGFPLTFVDWPSGSLASFPEAVCFDDWHTSLPARLQAPEDHVVDDMDGFKTVFEGEPVFKLRYTSLGGDGGSLLSLTVHHCIVGGNRIGHLQHDLTRACKGETLGPLTVGVGRDLFCDVMAQATPGHATLLQAKTAARAGEAEPRKSFREQWEEHFGSSLADLSRATCSANLNPRPWSFSCFEIASDDVQRLQAEISLLAGHKLTKNDVLFGLVWVLRSILSGQPLPGQQGSSGQRGVTSIDLALNNGLAVKLQDYFGNTAAPCTVSLPDHEESLDVGYSRAALLKGLTLAAVASMRSLQEWRRRGVNFQIMMQKVTAADSLAVEKELLRGMEAMGATIHCIVTNLAVFGGGREAALEMLNCGQGAPVQFFMGMNVVRERWAGIVPARQGKIYIQTVVPHNAAELLDASHSFATLIPHSVLRSRPQLLSAL